jgi:colanic acid/amylovoran biosynthesis glycosyltransferase
MQITVLMDRFPVLSQPWLYHTIAGLQSAGNRMTLLARSRGRAPHHPSFEKQVRFLPADSLSTPLILFCVGWYLLLILFRTRSRFRTALRCVGSVHGFNNKIKVAFRSFPLILHETEIVYFSFGNLAVTYLEYILATDARVVFSLRGSDIHESPFIDDVYRQRMVRALEAADGIHCASRQVMNCAQELVGHPLPSARVIYAALAPDFLTSSKFEAKASSADHPVFRIVTTARLDWRKGLEYGLMAMKRLVERGANFRWDIIGEGNHRMPLQWAIHDLGLEGKVFLLGSKSHAQVKEILEQADVYFHPALHEGFCVAIIEAMAVGLPVVATDVGGVREAFRSKEDGILVPSRDWIAMAAALEMLKSHPSRAARMGKSARRYVLAHFTSSQEISGFSELLKG